MKFPIDLNVAMTQCAEAAAQVLATKARSRSKSRGVDLAEIKWALEWGVQIDAMPATDLFNPAKAAARMAEEERRLHLTPEDRLDELLPRMSLHLVGSHGRARWCSEVITEVPQVLREHLLVGLRHQYEEDQRIANMTDEERRARADEALAQLRGTPGFFEIMLPDHEAP